MKLIYLPLTGGFADTQTGLARAFEEQFETKVFDFLNVGDPSVALLDLVNRFQPDFIHAQIQGTDKLEPWTFQRIKGMRPECVTTQWSGDVRVGPIPQMVEHGRHLDLTLLSGKGQIPMYQAAGCQRVAYWQVGVDRQQQFPETLPWSQRQNGIVFCGGNYNYPASNERFSLLKKLSRDFPDFYVYGNGWANHEVRHQGIIPYREQTNLYHRAKISIGFNNFNDVDWYFSDRQLVSMAAGTVHVCHYIPGLENIFEDGVDCVFYHNEQECVEKVRWLLSDEAARQRIGKAGQEKVWEHHTWETRVKEYITVIKDSVYEGKQMNG